MLRDRPPHDREDHRPVDDAELPDPPAELPRIRPYCPYTRDPGTTWTAPDMKKVQELVNRSGTKDIPVVVWSSPDW
jgi:hypothetical protein